MTDVEKRWLRELDSMGSDLSSATYKLHDLWAAQILQHETEIIKLVISWAYCVE